MVKNFIFLTFKNIFSILLIVFLFAIQSKPQILYLWDLFINLPFSQLMELKRRYFHFYLSHSNDFNVLIFFTRFHSPVPVWRCDTWKCSSLNWIIVIMTSSSGFDTSLKVVCTRLDVSTTNGRLWLLVNMQLF